MGFFALKVDPSQCQYLGFTLVNEDGVEEYYEFLVLRQGITTAPLHLFPVHPSSYLLLAPYSYHGNIHYIPG